MNDEEKQRILAVCRFLAGEKPEAICSSLRRSRPWLYKWIRRRNRRDGGDEVGKSSRPDHLKTSI